MQDMLWSVIWGSLSQIKGSKHYFEGEYLARFEAASAEQLLLF